MMNANDILISVIITTKNEEKNIERCLSSIKEQNYPCIEIIVVDNNSTDRTKDIASKYTDKVYNKGPERPVQRNMAVEMSTGEYFLQLDADQILQPTIVQECIDKVMSFRNKKDGLIKDIALYIPEVIIGNDSWYTKVRDYEKSFYTGTVIDCVRFMPVKIFHEVGGYDESMTGPEDWDLDNKIRARCIADMISTPMLHNEGHITFSKLIKKKSYYAKGMAKFTNKWRKHPATCKRLGLLYRFFGVFVENGKWKKVLQYPLLFLHMYITKIAIGIVYLMNRAEE